MISNFSYERRKAFWEPQNYYQLFWGRESLLDRVQLLTGGRNTKFFFSVGQREDGQFDTFQGIFCEKEFPYWFLKERGSREAASEIGGI